MQLTLNKIKELCPNCTFAYDKIIIFMGHGSFKFGFKARITSPIDQDRKCLEYSEDLKTWVISFGVVSTSGFSSILCSFLYRWIYSSKFSCSLFYSSDVIVVLKGSNYSVGGGLFHLTGPLNFLHSARPKGFFDRVV